MKKIATLLPVVFAVAVALAMSTDAFAQDAAAASAGNSNLGAGLAMGLGALGGTLGQGMAARGAYESISRNPNAASKLNAPFYVGLAFIESLVLFSLVVAFGIAR